MEASFLPIRIEGGNLPSLAGMPGARYRPKPSSLKRQRLRTSPQCQGDEICRIG